MNQPDDTSQLLGAHQQIIQAHLNKDVPTWLAGEVDEYLSANRGEIMYPTKAERAAMRQPYLEQTEFSEYRDLIPPIIKVSADGTLGWVVAQVKVVGVRTMPDGQEFAFDAVWAWVELYEKIDGRWLCTGNVSNEKP
jgi:hypothetical protein